MLSDTRCLIGDSPPHVLKCQVELLSHFALGFAPVEMLDNRRRANARYSRLAESPVWPAPDRRGIIGVRSPCDRSVVIPFHPLHERISRGEQQRLVVYQCDETQFTAQLAQLLEADEQPSPLADPRRRVRQRMRHSQLVPESRDEVANLVEPHLELAPILAQESRFQELRPSKAGVAGRFGPDDRLVVMAATLAALQPPTQRAPADREDRGRVSQ